MPTEPGFALPSDEPVLIGVSGGKDSTGLAVWAVGTYPTVDWHLVHVRHGLRDDALDAAIAEQTAQRLKRPFHLVCADWGAIEGDQRHEAAARTVRYQAFERIAQRLGARHLVLGHHLDDQAETILLRLVRGTGPSGMAGMKPLASRGKLVLHRPLLFWDKARIHSFIQDFPTIEDPTNADLTQRRSWIRHQVLPLLAQGRPDGQDPAPAIGRFTQLQAEQQALLDELLAPFRGPSWGGIHRIDSGLGRRLTRQLLYEALGFQVDYGLVMRIEGLLVGERIDIAGRRFAARDPFGWVIGPHTQSWTIASLPDGQLALDGLLVRPAQPGVKGMVQPHSDLDPLRQFPVPFILTLPSGVCVDRLRVRNRAPQDRPFAALFQRFPRSIRPHLPVVETEKGEILSIGPCLTPTIGRLGRGTQIIALSPS